MYLAKNTFLFLSLLVVGCSYTRNVKKLEIRPLPKSHVFSVPLDSLKKVLIDEFDKAWPEGLSDSLQYIYTREEFERIDNSLYFCLTNYSRRDRQRFKYDPYEHHYLLGTDSLTDNDKLRMVSSNGLSDDFLGGARVGPATGFSYNYIFDKTHIRPMYFAEFAFKLDEISERQTRVTVRALDTKIAVGREYIYNNHNFSWQSEAIKIPAEPSGVEEYQILIRLAKALGCLSEMAPLRIEYFAN